MDDLMHRKHNQLPLLSVEELNELLAADNSELTDRARELYAAAKDTPERCDDEELASSITDRIKLIQNCRKSLEGSRVATKEPFLTLERTVDGYFKKVTDGLDAAKTKLQRVLGDYHDREADKKRREAEETARREREEADRKRREAEAIEAAEKAAREAEERRRQEALDRAEKERKAAEEAEKRRVEAEKEAERKKKEADAALERAKDEENAKKRKIATEEAEKKRKEAEKAEKERIAAAEAAKKASSGAATAKIESARLEAKALEGDSNPMAAVAEGLREEAAQADKRADRSTRQAEAKSGKLSVTHGTYGSRSNLRQVWKGKITDRSAVKWRDIGPHISDTALQSALESWISVNCKGDVAPQLDGVEIWRENIAQVR